MTACVNRKHTKKVAAVVTASLVGALSLGVAPVAAMAQGGIDMLAVPSDAWEGVEFAWSVDADIHGDYTVQAGDQFMLTSATDAFGDPVSMSNLTVVYVTDADGNGKASNTDTVSATTPETADSYIAVVVNGRLDLDFDTTVTYQNLKQAVNRAIGTYKDNSHEVPFKVVAKSLTGAYAYQGESTADTSFKFTGFCFNDGDGNDIHFADADGNKIDLAADGVTARVLDANGDDINFSAGNTLTAAGTYTAYLSGDGTSYSGSTTFEFTIDKIDLANDTFTVKPVEDASGDFTAGTTTYSSFDGIFYVNGEEVAPNILQATVNRGVDVDGNLINNYDYDGTDLATVVLNITAMSGSGFGSSFVDWKATGEATVLVVDKVVADNLFFYDGESIPKTGLKFETAKGEAFDPSLISASLRRGGDNLPINVTVTKDGKAVTEYTEPGTYKVTVDVVVPDDLEYAGTRVFDVTVIARRYSEQPKAFVAIDGKDVKNPVEYDGEAVEPVIAVKAGSATVDPADYTVTYTDAKGEPVESIVEPGEYDGHIDFGEAVIWKNGKQTPVDDIDFTVTVTKAQIRSAKADKDVYDMTGEAVTPIFTAYNTADLEGLSLTIDPAETGVSYYKAVERTWIGNPFDPSDDVKYWDKTGDPIKASDLKKAGKYVAVLTAPADDPHFQGETTSEMFEISEYAVFSDVDASEWYADSVYNAAKLGYMTGISGTDLFMPKADITRAELAKVFANMAGEAFSPVYTPTKFGDVDPLAWYAGAVAWADEAGIVTGYDDVTFGPADKATREQVAVMLYRYAKGQGKDVSVEDADATLAAYKDADQVSDWAKEAMAWAVDNGIFGQGTDELWAKQNIQRSAVATIAVRFQPEALPEA